MDTGNAGEGKGEKIGRVIYNTVNNKIYMLKKQEVKQSLHTGGELWTMLV